jgi:multidrug efflux system outer membrane protein
MNFRSSTRSILLGHCRKARPFTAALAVGLLVSACKVGPNYQSPPMSLPATYRSPTTPATRPLATDWWQLFKDAQLTALEEAATIHNPNLQAAAQRVVQARQAARSVESGFYPTIGAAPAVTRSRTSGAPRSGSSQSRSTTGTTVQIPFDLSYEIDIWGRITRSVESAQAQAASASADYFVVLQTLQADVAQDYFTLRSLEAQVAILSENVALYRRQIELLETKGRAGLLAPSDMAQAQALLQSTLASLIEFRRQREDLQHALALLTGRTPAELDLPETALATTSPAPTTLPAAVPTAFAHIPLVPAGLPADLLRRRPDIAEAEQNLRAANADVGERVAEFFPRVTLTGSAGFESFDLAHALDWQSRVLSIGPSVSFPIFEGGRLTANLTQARARYEELYATYRNAVLTAIRDVEDSLTDLHHRADQQVAQAHAVDASREYLRLSEIQYRQGLITYLQVIDADRTLLTNQVTATQIEQQRLISTVLLIKALGGGWQPQQLASP